MERRENRESGEEKSSKGEGERGGVEVESVHGERKQRERERERESA